MKHITEILGGSSYQRHRNYKFFNATTLGKCFIPNIKAENINLWLKEKGYLKKNDENRWVVTEKGKPFLHSYRFETIELEGSGTVYWKRELLGVAEKYYGQLSINEELDVESRNNSPSKKTPENLHIKKMMDML